MTCLKAQRLITPFINDDLNIRDLEEFVEHVHTCKECREELEVYYALLTAMKQLDEDKNLSDDFSLELSEQLDKAREKIVHVRFLYYRKKGILILIIAFLAFLFSVQHYFTKKVEENPVTDSDFRLRISYRQERYEKLKEELENKLEKPVQGSPIKPLDD